MKTFIGFILLIVLVILSFFKIDVVSLKHWLGDFSMPLRYGMYRERNIMVEMRDGIQLATDVYRPLSGGPFPVILMRTTYGGTGFELNKFFVDNGYAVVVQDVRGRYGSQGEMYSPHRYSRSDGYDTIDWIIKQEWALGKVGTFGCSYLGESQIILAAAKHPNHIAMIAGGAGGAIGKAKKSYGYFGVYENGVLNLASALGWFTSRGATYFNTTPSYAEYSKKVQSEMAGLPVKEIASNVVPFKTGFDDIVSHKPTDGWWDQEGYIDSHDTFSTATLHVNTWYDQTVQDTFRLADYMAGNIDNPRAKKQHVLIDPGNHCEAGKLSDGIVKIGEMQFEYSHQNFKIIYLNWFDYWLKGAKVQLPPKFQYFVIHANNWRSSNQWPPAKVQYQNLYLNEKGKLNQSKPEIIGATDNGQMVDSYTYDPLDPVPTRGGPICCTFREGDIAGAVDQSELKSRDDVLIYTSNELDSDHDIIGNMKAILFVSTSATDTDFTVKVVDQYPNGKAYNLQDGVLRLRYRRGVDKPKLAKPGEVYQVELELRPTAYRIKKGHKIAVYISSSNFPRLARNLNTGKEEYQTKETTIATNSIHRSNGYPSRIELPVVFD